MNRSSKAFLSLVRNQKGLSLIEILIALTILGVAGTFITGRVFESLYEGQLKSTRIQMQNLEARLKEYRRHCGTYPTTEQGLEALVSKPTTGRECKRYAPGGYIEGGNVPVDPWDTPFLYESNGKEINIISFGSDGAEGGEGHDKDISLREDKK